MIIKKTALGGIKPSNVKKCISHDNVVGEAPKILKPVVVVVVQYHVIFSLVAALITTTLWLRLMTSSSLCNINMMKT